MLCPPQVFSLISLTWFLISSFTTSSSFSSPTAADTLSWCAWILEHTSCVPYLFLQEIVECDGEVVKESLPLHFCSFCQKVWWIFQNTAKPERRCNPLMLLLLLLSNGCVCACVTGAGGYLISLCCWRGDCSLVLWPTLLGDIQLHLPLLNYPSSLSRQTNALHSSYYFSTPSQKHLRLSLTGLHLYVLHCTTNVLLSVWLRPHTHQIW